MDSIIAFSDEQLRLLVNLQQQYQVWMEAEQGLARLPYNLKWKTISGRDYLYEVRDRVGNATSKGPRSAETEALHERYRADKGQLKERRNLSAARLDETCRLYRALRLPMISSDAAAILREADRRRLLGDGLLVVGTNAMPAYCVEAGGYFATSGLDETQDFDLAWCAREGSEFLVGSHQPIWDMLKAVDSTFTVNSERAFQARNARAYEIELLVAPSMVKTLAKGDCPVPVPLDEQEWLLQGARVDRVVVARDGSPARIVAPDPRWFALQKLWMSDQAKRNPLKRPKDGKQGLALLNTVWEAMPQYPLDAAFESDLPPPLAGYLEKWRAMATPLPGPRW